MNLIEVKEVTIEEVLKVHAQIPELNEMEPQREVFEQRYIDKTHVILVAYENEIPIGYLIAYDPEDSSFYCWLAGVIEKHRKKGALTKMMIYLEDWMRKNGYKKITIKTRNTKREMLKYLVKHDFDFTKVETMRDRKENRIYLEKEI